MLNVLPFTVFPTKVTEFSTKLRPIKKEFTKFSLLHGLIACPCQILRQTVSRLILSTEINENFASEIISYCRECEKYHIESKEYFQTISQISQKLNIQKFATTKKSLFHNM